MTVFFSKRGVSEIKIGVFFKRGEYQKAGIEMGLKRFAWMANRFR